MPAETLPFTLDEYQNRLTRVRAAMQAAGVEVIFCTDPSNMAWLTGYDGWSFYVHQGVLVSLSGDPVIWARRMDAMGAYRTVWMGADQVESYSDDWVMSPDRHAMTHLAQTIADRGWGRARLGVEMENYYYTARAHQVLSDAHQGAVVDATLLVNRCRAVKSQTELMFMRRAARIVERMHETAYEAIEPGRRKNEVVAEILHTATWGAEEDGVMFGGDYAAIAPLVPSGKDATAAHLTWDDRPFEGNCGTFFEIAGVYRRYHAPLCRTVWLGEPPRDVRAAEVAIIEGVADGIDAARVGNTAGDVARAFYAALARHKIPREGRCGYPIGLSYPPDWGERTFSIRPDDETEFEADMTFHFMPALWMEDWGLEITEPLRIVKNGPAECLANVERKVFVKP